MIPLSSSLTFSRRSLVGCKIVIGNFLFLLTASISTSPSLLIDSSLEAVLTERTEVVHVSLSIVTEFNSIEVHSFSFVSLFSNLKKD